MNLTVLEKDIEVMNLKVLEKDIEVNELEGS